MSKIQFPDGFILQKPLLFNGRVVILGSSSAILVTVGLYIKYISFYFF